MTPDDAFLQSIIENPDDDGPRLVYADFLEEHGQPARAALIRVQCQLAEGDHPELLEQEAALLKKFGREWAGPLLGLVKKWSYRRGFP
ncbi:TIGR02996 domain-containing protein, partial [Salmonella sp. M9-2]|uniref:TIGR02996 domain-containing protein n=1 Tax=Salmonella sp. M9-2 TaxID=3240317 RepID=UPI00352A34AD